MHCLLKMNKPLLFKLWFFFFWSEINKIIKFSEKNLKVVIYGIIIEAVNIYVYKINNFN